MASCFREIDFFAEPSNRRKWLLSDCDPELRIPAMAVEANIECGFIPTSVEQARRISKAIQHNIDAFNKFNPIFQDISFRSAEMNENRNPNNDEHMRGDKEFFTVWCPGSSMPMVQTFDTDAQAYNAAEDMARKNSGATFFVMKAVGLAKVEKPVVRKVIGEQK